LRTPCKEDCAVCAALRAAALRLAGAEGIEALTIERLWLEAGLSNGPTLPHYVSARSCLYDTYDYVSSSVYKDFAAAFAAEPDWSAALRLATETLLGRMAARPDEARFCFVEVLRGDHELLRRRDTNRRRLLSLFTREHALRRGHAAASEMQLEMLIGSSFQTIAACVAGGDFSALSALGPELESRASVFAAVAA
jgi:hypothetical protein